ncbi:hypothetical protein ACH5RR_029924 [Cinchona calisaya]|uniref:Myb-like domain-containing protein n=1 Tax=Cinchona calisaya TaxID=153742 RepID=A0ABD2YT91_9GENT
MHKQEERARMEAVEKDNRQVRQNKRKPRLRWTRELHDHFVKAIYQLGGAYEATPKQIHKRMGIKEITLNHIKSHLQKYRLSKEFHPRTNARTTSNVQVMLFEENGENAHRTVGLQTIEYMQASKGKSQVIEEQSQFNKEKLQDLDVFQLQGRSSKARNGKNSPAREAKSTKHQLYKSAINDRPRIHSSNSNLKLCKIPQGNHGNLAAEAKDDDYANKELAFAFKDCKYGTNYKPFDLNVSAQDMEQADRK